MKIACVMPPNVGGYEINFVGRRENVTYGWLLEQKENILNDNISEWPSLAYLYGLNADYLIIDQCNEELLSQYDVLITMGPLLNRKFRDDQILMYFEREPYTNHGNLTYAKSNRREQSYSGALEVGNVNSVNIPPAYDYHLNTCLGEFSGNIRNIPFWPRLMVDDMQKLIQPKDDSILLQCRTHMFNGLPDEYKSTYQFIYERSNFENSYTQYLKNISKTKFMISLDTTISPGMLVAECACLSTISLGRKEKMFQRMLFPEYCIIDSYASAFKK